MSVVLPPAGAVSLADAENESLRLMDQMYRSLAAEYPNLRLEQTAEGEITVMAPTFSDTGLKDGELYGQVYVWNKQAKWGYAFTSSTGFTFPNGAKFSPDASWIAKPRWDALTKRQKSDFAPICPDFVAELRSRSDRLGPLQKKMRQYVANGARLGWLIDPRTRRVEVYRPGRDVEVLNDPVTLSGEDVLPGLVLDLTEIFT